MKILIVMTQPFDPTTGGVQMSTYKLSMKFTQLGMESIVYSFANEGNIDAKFTRLITSEEGNIHFNPNNIRHFDRVIADEKPDVIIDQVAYENQLNTSLLKAKTKFGCVLLACLRTTLFAVKLNIDDYIDLLLGRLAPLFKNAVGRRIFQKVHKEHHAKSLKGILDLYDRFIMFGQPNIEEIRYFIGDYKTNKIAFIPNSIPDVQNQVPQKEKCILWLSRLCYRQKKAENILPVWENIAPRLPDWRLDIVGDGDAYKDIESQIEQRNIPRVKLYGKQKANPYFKRAAIYFMTSAFEGFPNTVIEAQSFGAVPVIFNNYPMAGGIIEDGINGSLIRPFNIDEMSDEIVKIATDKEEIEEMQKASLENAKRFHIDVVGEMWEQLFAELVERNKDDNI